MLWLWRLIIQCEAFMLTWTLDLATLANGGKDDLRLVRKYPFKWTVLKMLNTAAPACFQNGDKIQLWRVFPYKAMTPITQISGNRLLSHSLFVCTSGARAWKQKDAKLKIDLSLTLNLYLWIFEYPRKDLFNILQEVQNKIFVKSLWILNYPSDDLCMIFAKMQDLSIESC